MSIIVVFGVLIVFVVGIVWKSFSATRRREEEPVAAPAEVPAVNDQITDSVTVTKKTAKKRTAKKKASSKKK